MEKSAEGYTQKNAQSICRYMPCVPWRMLAGLALVCLGVLAVALLPPSHSVLYSVLYSVINIVYPLLLACICMKGFFPTLHSFLAEGEGKRPDRRFCPFLLGVSMLFLCSSHVAFWLYFIFLHEEVPFPSLPYVLTFGIYPCFVGAVLCLPMRGVSPVARLRILLDSLIIIVAVAALGFYFVLAPLLVLSDEPPIVNITGTLFLIADLIMLFCLLLVVLRSEEPQLSPVLLLLGLTFVLFFVIHIGRLFEIVSDEVHWSSRLTLVWIPAMALIVVTAQTLKNIFKSEREVGCALVGPGSIPRAPGSLIASRWKPFFALFLVMAAIIIICLFWISGLKELFRGQNMILYAGELIVLMLIILRQLLAMYEIGVLQGRLQRRGRSLSLLNEMLARQATTDALTGLPNHRELLARLNEALRQAQRTASTCAVIFMDLDHFKAINDNYGHLVGDAVLCEFSELLLTQMSERDYLGRWGGEEFVAVLPGIEPNEACEVAERMRVKVEEHLFIEEQGIHLTCSIGIATYPCDATRYDTLLMNADRAMYTAKRLGRNQTRCASEPLVLAMGMLGEEPETASEAEMLAVVESFIAALEARDALTGQHCRRVAALSLKLALALGLDWSDACIIGMGGLLHDLGKVAIPDAILFKHGKLSAPELEYIARHPLIGEEILAPLPSLRAVAEIVRTHHEWMNGSGYPDGLRGEAIPLGARIVAVADAYDAIISHRVYREGRASSEAAKELSKGAGRQFDPHVVDVFVRLLAVSPRFTSADQDNKGVSPLVAS